MTQIELNAKRYEFLRRNCCPTRIRQYFSIKNCQTGVHLECGHEVDNHFSLYAPEELDKTIDLAMKIRRSRDELYRSS